MGVCTNCKYFDQCGSHSRTEPCDGRETKTNRTSSYRGMSLYDRTKAQVYATGNKWAIENFHATHD